MAKEHPRSVTVGYYVGSVLLVVGLGIAALLFTMLLRPPSTSRIEVGDALATACEPGNRAPGCFAFSVGNGGSEVVSAQCVVVPAEHTDARFVTGDPATVMTLRPSEERIVHTKVDPLSGGVVVAPTLSCTPIEGG